MSEQHQDNRQVWMEGLLKKNARAKRLVFVQKSGARLVFFAALLLVWQALASAGLWSELLFPAPRLVIEALMLSFADGAMPQAILASMKRLVVGYSLSLLIGIPLGLVLGRIRLLDNTLGTLILGLQALPSICWMPLAVLWFGLSEASMQFVVVMGAVMAVILAVRDGVKNIPRLYIRASRVLGATGWKGYLYVILPASLPALLTGAKLGWSFAWRALMAAELIYVSAGLGSTLMMGRELHDMALVVATMFVIIAIGLVTDRLVFGRLEKGIHRRWGMSSH
jgi:NitT/TauT family transport system permease protein